MSTQHSNDRRSGSAGIWKIAAGVLALVVIGLVAYLLLGRHDSPDTTPTQATPATPTTSSTAPVTPAVPATSETTAQAPTSSTTAVDSSWADAGCNGTTGSTGNPATALAQVTWKPFLTAAVPTSKTLGPATLDGVLRRCYQHSPAGAVMAAANMLYAPLAPGGERVVEQQWTSGPGRDAMLRALATWTGSTSGVAAYRLEGCDAQACNVELVTASSGRYGQSVMPMVWQDGDWKVDGSHTTPDPSLVSGIPVGFTAWGAS